MFTVLTSVCLAKGGKPSTGGSANNNKPTVPSKPSTSIPAGFTAENGTFTLGSALPLTVDYSSNGALIATIAKDQQIKYNAFCHANGYVWIRQPRGNGYGYMATGFSKNGVRQDYWGTFS